MTLQKLAQACRLAPGEGGRKTLYRPKEASCLFLASFVSLSLIAFGFVLSEPAAAQSTQKSQSEKSASAAKAAKSTKKVQAAKQRTAKKTSTTRVASRKSFAKAKPTYNSMGSRLGLRSELTEIALNSSAVLVVDQRTGEILLEKNPDVALPIASITKVMTAIVVMEAGLPLNETIIISKEDTQLEKYSGSRLRVGAKFTRAELLHLALMSSENRAAHALGRNYPGGLSAFVEAMNEKAQAIGMSNSKFVEPTGLSSANVSTPRDLSRLVNAAHEVPLIRQYSTDREAIVRVGGAQQQFRNTNALTRKEDWDLGLSKTGFIRDAGKCLVMQAVIDDQDVIIVMLDAQASSSRLSDAERIRRWLSTEKDRQTPARS